MPDLPTSDYTHLHVHSQYTLLGATAPVQSLVEQAAADGLAHLALTDTHALYGAVAFAQACEEAGVQPVIGMMVQVQKLPEPSLKGDVLRAPEPVVLLASGPAGYRSLCRLSSHLQADVRREEALARGIDWTTLKAHRGGLLCIVGGRRSHLVHLLQSGDSTGAARYLAQVAGVFDDRAYIALEVHTPADVTLAQECVALGERLGLMPVAVQPVYCMQTDERDRLRLLAAIDHNCRLGDVPAAALPDGGDALVDLHWLSPNEMARRFEDFPDALTASAQIAARCARALPTGKPIWPRLDLPADATPESALIEQAQAGVAARFPVDGTTDSARGSLNDVRCKIQARLDAELGIINRLGFAPLFLLVADIVAYARRRHIPVSTRGSVANSLVAYALGITTVDPIAHDLLFERFLNPARSSPPDIDLDFCSVRRDEVLRYVRGKYGEDRVALLATVSTLQPKSALRETAKAYGADEKLVAQLVRRLPDRWHPDPRRRIAGTPDELLEGVDSPLARRIVEDAYAILGAPHHLSIHPGGMVVTPGPQTDYFPVQWTPKGFLISQFGHEDMEVLGLPKIDLLGIRALTVLADAAELVRTHSDPAFRLEAIPLEDERTGALVARGDTVGVFQCDSNGARRTLRQLQARTVRDLAVANAFFKPGPATGGMATDFIRRYRGEARVAYLHPALEPILAPTQGVLLFQEQILRVAVEIAGLSWAEADHLRRGMSKFESQAMEEMAARFIEGCCRGAQSTEPGSPVAAAGDIQGATGGPGLRREEAEQLWAQVRAFAGYGFNQGHATAYADVSYRSAYLKVHWPAAFFAARLANYGGYHHPAIYMAEAVRWGIDVRPPHINHSDARFTLRYRPKAQGAADVCVPVLWMGLGQVNSLRRAAIEAILQARACAPFTSLADLLQRVSLRKKEIAHLIQCGALDGLAPDRATLLAQAEATPRPAQVKAQGPQLAFDFGPQTDDEIESSVAPAKAHAESPGARLAWERRILGWPVSVHPLQMIPSTVRGTVDLVDAEAQGGRRVLVAAYRLPGWTGGQGCFVSDGNTFCTAILPKRVDSLKPWVPVCLAGRWMTDEWGSGWLQVETVEQLEHWSS